MNARLETGQTIILEGNKTLLLSLEDGCEFGQVLPSLALWSKIISFLYQ